jgi:acyl dehydratase
MNRDQLYFEDVDIGDEIESIERTVTLQQVRAFLAIRGGLKEPRRFTDEVYAKSEGLPYAIVPGALNSAMLAQLLTSWSPTVFLKQFEVSFRRPVPHNTTLELKGVVTAKEVVNDEPQISCDVLIESEEGTVHVIGHATVVLPMQGT